MKADKELKLRGKKKKLLDKIERPEENDETKIPKSKRKKKLGLFAKIFIIFILCLSLLFVIFNINYLTPAKMKEHMNAVFANFGNGGGYPYRFSSNNILSFQSFNLGDKVILTDSDVIILNSSANPVLSYKHSMSNPILKVSRDRLLLFDQGSTKAVILTQSGEVITFPNDDKIICADISDSGKSVIVTKTSKNKEEVNVYAFSGKKIMTWEKGDGYILDVALNSGGSLLGVALVDTEDAVETINVALFGVSNAKQKGYYQIKSSTLYDIAFLKANDLSVLCSNKIFVLNAKAELKAECEHPSITNLQLFADKNGHIINTYSQYNNGEFNVDVYNASLEKIYTKQCDNEVVRVYSDGNTLVSLYSNHTADVNMLKGKVTYSAKFDIDPIFVLCNSRQVFACANGSVEKVKAVKQ
ncbi:MAG: hypothetical protein IKE65_08530 [Clostridia bacterium]|nr:hypothetical protein [Clostridia bacterium]